MSQNTMNWAQEKLITSWNQCKHVFLVRYTTSSVKLETFWRTSLTKNILILYEITPNKVHGANMGPIWSRQDPDGPLVGCMNFAIWDIECCFTGNEIPIMAQENHGTWNHWQFRSCFNSLFRQTTKTYWNSTLIHPCEGIQWQPVNSTHRGPCLTTATWRCQKNFSQWECSFHWKLCCHWLEFLRQRQMAVVRQGPGLAMCLYVKN